jgi:hypothetical protein
MITHDLFTNSLETSSNFFSLIHIHKPLTKHESVLTFQCRFLFHASLCALEHENLQKIKTCVNKTKQLAAQMMCRAFPGSKNEALFALST